MDFCISFVFNNMVSKIDHWLEIRRGYLSVVYLTAYELSDIRTMKE